MLSQLFKAETILCLDLLPQDIQYEIAKKILMLCGIYNIKNYSNYFCMKYNPNTKYFSNNPIISFLKINSSSYLDTDSYEKIVETITERKLTFPKQNVIGKIRIMNSTRHGTVERISIQNNKTSDFNVIYCESGIADKILSISNDGKIIAIYYSQTKHVFLGYTKFLV
jgi:hypothetical protein